MPVSNLKRAKPTSSSAKRIVLYAYWPPAAFTKALGEALGEHGYRVSIRNEDIYSDARRFDRGCWVSLDLGRIEMFTDDVSLSGGRVFFNCDFTTNGLPIKRVKVTRKKALPQLAAYRKLAEKVVRTFHKVAQV